MTIPAWHLITWKPVRASLAEFRAALAQMRPLGQSGEALRRPAPRQGQALWAATCNGHPVGLAWDWAEVREDVLALADPMNVLSNISLVDERGEPLADAERIVHLNSAVHVLDWQTHARCRHGAAWVPQALAA